MNETANNQIERKIRKYKAKQVKDGDLKEIVSEIKQIFDDICIRPESPDSFKVIVLQNKKMIEKLSKIKPENLGQASRISGVNPADIAALNIILETL